MRIASRKRPFDSSLNPPTASVDCGRRETNRNETTNVIASTKKTSTNGCPLIQPPFGESNATTPKAAAPNGMVPYDEARIAALAGGSWSSPTRSGISESRAGRNTMPAASSRKAQTYTHHSAVISGMAMTIPARTRSVACMRRRRSQPLMPRAASGAAAAAGSSRSSRTPPTAVDDPETCSTSAISATVTIQSPNPETACPMNRARNAGRRNTSFMRPFCFPNP